MEKRIHSLALVLGLLLGGCSGDSRPAMAETAMREKVANESQGNIRLVSFKKTDGVERDFFGQLTYEMKYEAQIEFLKDCHWISQPTFEWDFHTTVGGPQNSLETFSPAFFGKQPAKQGDKKLIAGHMMFLKSEKGWRIKSIN